MSRPNSHQDGANDDDKTPWSRPGWIASVGFLALIVVVGLLVIVLAPRHDDARAARPTEVAAAPSAAPTPTARSGCDLPPATDDASMAGKATIRLTGTRWLYEGASSYPVSATYGPARRAPEGYRYCYQHSAGGALFMAANTVALSLPGDQASAAYAGYIIGTGPYHDQQLTAGGAEDPDPSLRMMITGYRILEYDGTTATIELAVHTTTIDQSMELSLVFDLVWQRGDWRYSADVPEPLSVTQASGTVGYTSWGDS